MKTILVLFLLTVVPLVTFAAKTDTLTMNNGDRITCEIKTLNFGKLTVKTSDLGTLSIKWLSVDFVESKQVLEITFRDHTRLYGTFLKSDSAGYAIIKAGIFQETYALKEIVSIAQISASFWQGLDGSVSYGVSFATGTDNFQSTFRGQVSYKQKKFKHQVNLTSIIAIGSTDTTKNQSANYSVKRYVMKRGYVSVLAGWQQNTELGIDSRVLTGLTFGIQPVDNSVNMLTFAVGTVYNKEYTNEGAVVDNVEGVIEADYYIFLLYKPKISLTINAKAYPSFTETGRIRSDITTQLSWEIFNDFTLTGSYYNNFDSKPPSTEAVKMSWGYTATIGYTF